MDRLSHLRSEIHEAYVLGNMDLAFVLEEQYEDLYTEQRKPHTHYNTNPER